MDRAWRSEGFHNHPAESEEWLAGLDCQVHECARASETEYAGGRVGKTRAWCGEPEVPEDAWSPRSGLLPCPWPYAGGTKARPDLEELGVWLRRNEQMDFSRTGNMESGPSQKAFGNVYLEFRGEVWRQNRFVN